MRSALSVPQRQTTARASGETQCNPRRADGSDQQQRNDGPAHARDREASAISCHLRSITARSGRLSVGRFGFLETRGSPPLSSESGVHIQSEKAGREKNFPVSITAAGRERRNRFSAPALPRSPREVSTMQIHRFMVCAGVHSPDSVNRQPSISAATCFCPALFVVPGVKNKISLVTKVARCVPLRVDRNRKRKEIAHSSAWAFTRFRCLRSRVWYPVSEIRLIPWGNPVIP